MRLNILAVGLFAIVATLIQLANCLPTRRFDTNYFNEKDKLNETNVFMIPSNNLPLEVKIQATQTKNRSPVDGLSKYSLSDSPPRERTSHTYPKSATDPKMETAPTTATNTKMETSPTSATDPKMETAPTTATNTKMETAPTTATDPKIETPQTPKSQPTTVTTAKPHYY